MFSAIVRRAVQPSLRQAHPYTHTRYVVSSSSSKLDTKGSKLFMTSCSESFQLSELLVQDVSGSFGSFYAITIASTAFKGIPVVKQHRLVNEALEKEIEGIHGLQLKAIPQ